MDNKNKFDLDKIQLLGIFPEEIWLMISASMIDNNDRTRLSNSSLFFWNLLSSQRTTFLFPNVWKLLEPRFDNQLIEYIEVEHIQTTICESCGRVRSEQPYSKILNLRLVCRKWCEAIDTIFESNPCKFGSNVHPDEERNNFYWRLLDFEDHVDNVDYFQEFYRHFQSTHPSGGITGRSPFFTRAVSIGHGISADYPDELNEAFFDQISEFLTKYGQHVWYCHIRTWFEIPFTETYMRLHLWLTRMPNLKTLELDIFPNEEGDDYGDPDPPQRGLKELSDAIHSNPLPCMESLEYVKIRSCPILIFNELLRRNQQVAKLRIFQNQICGIYCVTEAPIHLSNLKEFSTLIHKPSDLQILSIPMVNCPISKLHLDIHDEVENCIDWRQVFSMLQQCGDTLTELVLNLPKDDFELNPEYSPLRLNLHHVKVLKLTLQFYCAALDFILPMKNTLEFLDVKFPRVDNNNGILARNEKAIYFLSCREESMERNAWKIFPKLKRVRYFETVPSEKLIPRLNEFLIWSHERGGQVKVEMLT